MECSVISQMLYKDFAKGFENMFGETIELKTLEKELSNTVSVNLFVSLMFIFKL